MPFSYLEKQAFKKGCRTIAGIDEVGRGPLAGPIVSAVLAIRKDYPLLIKKLKIRDSKSLSKKQREEVFEMINKEPDLEWQVSAVWPKVIDRVNIFQATMSSWKRCLKRLNSQPDFLFLDGNTNISNFKIDQRAIVKGDQKILVLALASIMAKVHRDRIMERFSKVYPEYGFNRHKGYGTKLHLARLNEFGPCQIHRKSFRPVFKNLLFKDKVYYLVSQIPKGQVMTYQEVACKIGHPNAFRAVGNTLNKNRSPKVPCHRVIRSDGKIGGYNLGSRLKRELLIKEGVFLDRL